jgi:endonuclease/exonuclease/phosphatase family metal-dependent hydrolase
MKLGSLAATAALTLSLLSCGNAGSASVPGASFEPDVIIPFSSNVDAKETVTIAAWNVEGCDLGKTGSAASAGIASALKENGVEVAAFEEIEADDLSALPAALKSAETGLNNFRYSSRSDGYNSYAVASKYPILSADEILPPSSKTWPRCIYKVRVDVGKGLTLFVCHLKAMSDSEAKREAQALALANYIRENYAASLSTETLVILGDMNTTNVGDLSSDPGSTLSLLALRDDADSGNDFTSMPESDPPVGGTYTWEGDVAYVHTQSSLDHILLSPAARARYKADSLKIVRTDSSGDSMQINSDHYPVVLDIYL